MWHWAAVFTVLFKIIPYKDIHERQLPELSVLKCRGYILRVINGNVTFIIILFETLKVHCIFQYTLYAVLLLSNITM